MSNPSSAVPPKVFHVDSHTDEVSCDGGGTLGHPVVWYNFRDQDQVKCLYCDRLFVKESGHNS